MKQLFEKFIILSVLPVVLFLLSSCRTIPPGHTDGAIVAPTESTHKVMDGNAALNYMVVSLVMRCDPIASSGSGKPRVLNDFTAAPKGVDYLQMSLWNRLGEMNIIYPVAEMSEKPQFKLSSEIKELPHPGDFGENMVWNIILTDIKSGKKVWHESIDFLYEEGAK